MEMQSHRSKALQRATSFELTPNTGKCLISKWESILGFIGWALTEYLLHVTSVVCIIMNFTIPQASNTIRTITRTIIMLSVITVLKLSSDYSRKVYTLYIFCCYNDYLHNYVTKASQEHKTTMQIHVCESMLLLIIQFVLFCF